MSTRVPREKAVFVEALEIADPEQRRQFLDQACGADKALREQVEKLLALSQSAGDFFKDCAPALEAEAADAAQVLSAAESAVEPEISETKCIGPYKLLQKLGEGGCGVVYMAEQEQPIRRRVALKIIKLGMDTKNVIARFEAERQALALMDHPNIARVLDAGATETGRPYFVMELVYGVKITDYCDQNRVSMQERLQLFIQVCNAVQHAHQKGIIHRDLKPSNIMVTMHDGVPVPKVIDFGIAKATEQRLTDKTLFTSYAQLMGTPAYMSPEQMEWSGLNLDTRSDIYSLGVLLYEILTGRTPFDTTDLLKVGVEELRRTVCEQEPLSPSAKLQTLNNEELTKTARMRRVETPRLLSQLHGDLDWIVLKCLEKDRTRRYETANALAMDIERYLHQEAVLARPPSRLYRLQKLVRRNRMMFLFGAATVTALFLGTIFSTMMFVKEREARSSEARLRREAELREQASHVALLVTQRRFEEADKLVADLPLNKPSIEVSSELRALGDWHAANGWWPEAVARFESVVKVNQLDPPDLVSEDQLKLAVAFLKSGNRQGYEAFRRSEAAKLGLTNLASDYCTFKLALLLPPDPNMLQLFTVGEEAVEKRFPNDKEMRPNPLHAAQWSEVLALLEYREGHFSKALYWCYHCESYPVYNANPAAVTTVSLIKALSNWRSGNYQTAVVDWTAAFDLIQARSRQGLKFENAPSTLFPGAPEDLEGPWHEWMIADLLMHECDELMAQSDHTLDSMSNANNASKDTDVPLYRALGEWHAIRGEWEQARNRFEYVLQFQQPDDPHSSGDYYHEALALLKLGDETGFVRLRDAALNRFKGTTNEATAQYAVKTGLLLPNGDALMASLQPFVQVLNRASASAGPIKEGMTTPASWDFMVLGLLEYRRGNYAQAVDWCRRSLDTSTYIAIPTIHDRTILAMSFHKLGDDATARSELAKARSLIQSGLNRGFDSWNWREWVFARLLLQEADGLIPQAPPPESPK
ncbi:MAG: serine/threonine protein kinase [Limisphaerales bacterium]